MTSNDSVASRLRSCTPATISPSSIPAQDAARRETLVRQYGLLAFLSGRGAPASENAVTAGHSAKPLSVEKRPIVLVFQSLREGAGSSTVASAAAWQLSSRRDSRVLAVAPQCNCSGFCALFNLPAPPTSEDAFRDTFWRYSEPLFLALDIHENGNGNSEHPPSKFDTAALCGSGFTHVVVDLGHADGDAARRWRNAADIVVTVAEPDTHTAMKLSEDSIAHNEVVLFNKALSSLQSHTDVMQFLRATPGLAARIAPQNIPLDEFAARSALQRGPVTQLARFSESAQAIAALTTWLILRAARLREEARC